MESTQAPYMRLPYECWDLIFSYGMDRQDYLRISLVCKYMNTAVQPSLYSTFSWIPGSGLTLPSLHKLGNHDMKCVTKRRREKWSTHFGPFTLQSPYLLLRSILARPERANYIRNVRLLAPTPEDALFFDLHEARECGFSSEEFDICSQAIKQLPVTSQKNWLAGLHKGRLDVAVGLLLLRLHGLSTIEIRIRHTSAVDSVVVEALRANVDGRAPVWRYPNIETVRLTVDQREQSQYEEENHIEAGPVTDLYKHHAKDLLGTFHSVPTILGFTKLRSLSLTGCSPGSTWQHLPLAPNLTHLKLRHGIINEDQLSSILACTPALTNLDVQLVYHDRFSPHLNCRILMYALTRIHTTLQRLVLDVKLLHGEYRPGPQWDVVNEMGKWKHFTSLRHLELPMLLLISELVALNSASHLFTFADRGVDHLGVLLPDGLEAFGGRGSPNINNYAKQMEATRSLGAYFRMNDWVRKVGEDCASMYMG